MNQAFDNVLWWGGAVVRGEVGDRFYAFEFPAALPRHSFHTASCERRTVQAHVKLMTELCRRKLHLVYVSSRSS